MLSLPETAALRTLSHDGWLLFAARLVRMFAYGFLAIVLALYLAETGLTGEQIGLLLSATLIGDATISLGIAAIADRIGRRRMLMIGTGLMVFAGIVFALSANIILLTVVAIIGTISPSGNEVGPFLSIEHAALPQTTGESQRTGVFAWYSLVGSVATATGALFGGGLASLLQSMGVTALSSYRVVLVGYALLGLLLAAIFSRLSASVEARPASASTNGLFGLHRSRGVVGRLSALFMLDAFAGGLVVQSLVAYWFHIRFGVTEAGLGGIFFGANLFAAFSALAAARVAARFGLINTMVWTHIPSNVLLMAVPLMPTFPLAVVVLLARFSISQMDVPTRQSYLVAVVDPDERSAAAGITSVARAAGAALAPLLAGVLLGASLFSAPFFLAGGLKIVYDLALYRSFRAVRPPEEQKQGS
jgi:MFS family permease